MRHFLQEPQTQYHNEKYFFSTRSTKYHTFPETFDVLHFKSAVSFPVVYPRELLYLFMTCGLLFLQPWASIVYPNDFEFIGNRWECKGKYVINVSCQWNRESVHLYISAVTMYVHTTSILSTWTQRKSTPENTLRPNCRFIVMLSVWQQVNVCWSCVLAQHTCGVAYLG